MRFVTVTHPDQWKSLDIQTAVRRNATRYQHLHQRRGVAFRHFTPPPGASTKKAVEDGEEQEQQEVDNESATTTKREKSPRLPSIAQISGERSYSTGARAFQLLLLRDSGNTVGKCLAQLGTDLGAMLDRFTAIIDLHAPEYERRFGAYGFGKEAMRSSVLRFVYTDACPMAASLLMASIYFLSGRGEDPSNNTALLQLRGFVMQTIQEALSEKIDHAVSDQVVFAVVFLAKCDAMHGWSDSHAAHMEGLVRMVNLRGGQHMLGLNGILGVIMLWFDSVTAAMLKKAPFYDYDSALQSQLRGKSRIMLRDLDHPLSDIIKSEPSAEGHGGSVDGDPEGPA